MTKNIEMNVKTSTGYDLLYPATESRQVLNLLTDSTKTYIGLDSSATPDDAFRSLYLLNVLSDKASFRLTVKTAGGTPIANLPVTCDKYLDGNSNPVAGPLYTDENGVIDTFFANGSVTLSITGYADLENWSKQYSVVNGEQYEQEVALTTRNFLKITSSGNYKFSANVNRVDVSVGGGGGNGVNNNTYGGGGGGGGYSTIQTGVSFTKDTAYPVVVGSSSGQSSFLGVVANGGTSGSNRNGGAGNGAGGGVGVNGGAGTTYIYTSFTAQTLYGGGGGGGAASGTSRGVGGSPGGGAGGVEEGWGNSRGTNGTAGLGGGGGGSGSHEAGVTRPGGTGASGVVAIRMHLKVT